MRKPFVFGIALVMAAAAASAAEIHGTVSEGGKPLPQGVALKLECGERSRRRRPTNSVPTA